MSDFANEGDPIRTLGPIQSRSGSGIRNLDPIRSGSDPKNPIRNPENPIRSATSSPHKNRFELYENIINSKHLKIIKTDGVSPGIENVIFKTN
ncbi:hypothetical protein L596_001054 [Steinernema carpocapsae]|uniref:Uncharacterized protein n=1 Tax=Steinernema carpocapsae TaxID=34508 RepID=A0A4U8UM90_STECR|nr:hypothetical protein L596_001054 [Steinernema carpocapsae]